MNERKNYLVNKLTFVATLGGLLFGYDTAAISGAVGAIDANFINPLDLSETARSSLSGWTISSALFGCVIGAVLAGWLSTRFGRKGGLLFAACLFVISAIGSAVPEIGLGAIGGMGPAALWSFVGYRVLCGIGIGIASMLSPLYIAEIAPASIRGRLVAFNQLAIVLGMLLVYFVNWAIATAGNDAWVNSIGWRWMLVSEAIPALLFLVLLLTVPDTPRWLVLRGRLEEAALVLQRIGPGEVVGGTIRQIQASLEDAHKKVAVRLFAFGPTVIFIGISLSAFQQLIGINAVLYYAPLMFKNMGSTTDTALLQTTVVGLANVIFTGIAIYSVDHFGRKPLLMIGGLVMAVSMFALGFLFQAQSLGMMAVIAVITYIAGFAFSWGPVTWVLLAEIFPNAIKDRALSIAVAAQWVTNLLVSWSFKIIDENSWLNSFSHHGFAYWIYGGMSLLAVFFVFRWVPETKRRTLEDIQHLWSSAKASTA